ncbi:hypothetical protein PG999_006696 [Apiospora kogelbergensis]|uniref:Uncharacterized protein n=1 Tax=Apiospora kogelbergensis TaxID=1337665 RepID=A0AAW0QW78_9PEZI
MPEHQGPPSTQGAAPSPNNAVRQQDKPDIASIWSDSSTVWSSHDRVDSQVPPASSSRPKESLAQRFKNVFSDVGKPPTARFDSEHGTKPKTPGTVDTMSRPPRI